MTLKVAIEEAILNAAPDVTGLVVDGVAEPAGAGRSTFVPLDLLREPGGGDQIAAKPQLLSSGAGP
jgi:hypothetical protein